MDEFSEEQFDQYPVPESNLLILWMFVQQLAQGIIFIIFSTFYYGSQHCEYLKNYTLIYGIIMIPDSILTLIWNVYQYQKQNQNQCALNQRAFDFIFNITLYFILLIIVCQNEDCGLLQMFSIIYLITQFIQTSLFGWSHMKNDNKKQKAEIQNDFN